MTSSHHAPYTLGYTRTTMLQWQVQRVAIPRGGANPQNRAQFGLESATRLHEVRTGFHDVTGGVYKARERIHDVVADAPLLAIPTSCSRVADYNLNWAQF